MKKELRVIPITGLPEIVPESDLAKLIFEACEAELPLQTGDVLVVTQKVISKAEGQLVDLDSEVKHRQLVESESVRILRRRGDLVITETKHGFICANAGIDLSNVENGKAALLPEDPDRSALRLRKALMDRFHADVAVIISDTFGRPWRRGVTDVAIGVAGIKPVIDLRGTQDALGRELQVTEVAIADELTAAAELVMGKSSGIAAAIVRGVNPNWLGPGTATKDLVRSYNEDLFR